MTISAVLKDHYERGYADYSRTEWRSMTSLHKAANIMQLCQAVPHERILEIGAGDGAVLGTSARKQLRTRMARARDQQFGRSNNKRQRLSLSSLRRRKPATGRQVVRSGCPVACGGTFGTPSYASPRGCARWSTRMRRGSAGTHDTPEREACLSLSRTSELLYAEHGKDVANFIGIRSNRDPAR